jgi:hypothetical protein
VDCTERPAPNIVPDAEEASNAKLDEVEAKLVEEERK